MERIVVTFIPFDEGVIFILLYWDESIIKEFDIFCLTLPPPDNIEVLITMEKRILCLDW